MKLFECCPQLTYKYHWLSPFITHRASHTSEFLLLQILTPHQITGPFDPSFSQCPIAENKFWLSRIGSQARLDRWLATGRQLTAEKREKMESNVQRQSEIDPDYRRWAWRSKDEFKFELWSPNPISADVRLKIAWKVNGWWEKGDSPAHQSVDVCLRVQMIVYLLVDLISETCISTTCLPNEYRLSK